MYKLYNIDWIQGLQFVPCINSNTMPIHRCPQLVVFVYSHVMYVRTAPDTQPGTEGPLQAHMIPGNTRVHQYRCLKNPCKVPP